MAIPERKHIVGPISQKWQVERLRRNEQGWRKTNDYFRFINKADRGLLGGANEIKTPVVGCIARALARAFVDSRMMLMDIY